MVGPFGFGIKPEPVSKVGAAGKSRGIILCLGLSASVLFGTVLVNWKYGRYGGGHSSLGGVGAGPNSFGGNYEHYGFLERQVLVVSPRNFQTTSCDAGQWRREVN